MTSSRRYWTVASLLMLLTNVFSGHPSTCRPDEYPIENRCCRMCSPGEHVKTDCKVSRPTSCRPCSNQSYMNQSTGLKHCFPCTHCDEGSGLKTKASCSPTSDTVCEPLEGFYCVEFSDNDCEAAKKCSDCSTGTFSNGSFTSCRPHTQGNTENRQLVKAGTASTDAECEEHADANESQLKLTLILVTSVAVLSALALCAVCAVIWTRKQQTPQCKLKK
ncbi:tumor necrosis factor receptor superfamily member 14-like isoform X2 [Betta splendens]|nr:tumor necrosis factor receptor superfamily member 14-like isoform X2 [Betta splendens]